MQTLLVSPSYRGWVLDDGPDSAVVRVQLSLDDAVEAPAAIRLLARLTSADSGETLAEQTVDDLTGDEVRLRVPLPHLVPGGYWLKLRLVDTASGETTDEAVHRLERKTGPMPTSFIDEHNRLMVDGRPFFPLGMYWSNIDEQQLRVYTEAPFNCLMPYGPPTREQMDLAESMGLKVIYSIKDFYYDTTWCPDFIASEADEEGAVRGRVREFRDHPALLAWYLNDERPLSMLPRLEAHQRWVEEEDPDHPTWVVLFQVSEVAHYARSFDAIGTDPYPIPDRPAAMAGEWARMTREAVADARGIWMVPQAFRWPQKDRPPSLEEMRSMAWQCIAEGADGLIFYSWFDLRGDRDFPFEERWEQLKQVAAEISEMAPVLLSVEPAPAIQVEGTSALHWTTRSREGTTYLIMVNDGEAPIEATVRLGRAPRRVTLDGQAVSLSAGNALTIDLDPLAVAIYHIEM
jgi:hypothetical protein